MNRLLVTSCRSIVNGSTATRSFGLSLSQPNWIASRSTPSVAGPAGTSIHSLRRQPALGPRCGSRRAAASGRTEDDATCRAASPGAFPRARGSRTPLPRDRAADGRAGRCRRCSSASTMRRSASLANACTVSRVGHSNAASCHDRDSCGSMPRAKSVSSRVSTLAPPSAFFTRALKLNPGRWPS